MDVLMIILGGFYINKLARKKGADPRPWVIRMIGACIAFEVAGFFFAFAINGGNMPKALLLGFFCAIGGLLLVKYSLDRKPDKQ